MLFKSWVVAFAILPIFTLVALAQEKAVETTDGEVHASVWMKKKMEFSQKLLEGLATNDLNKVADSARAMQGLSKIEAFVRGRTPGYRAQLQIFQSATEEIIKQADKDNLDGAALGFTQLTISCIHCHKQLRETAR